MKKNDFYMKRLCFTQTKTDDEELRKLIHKWDNLLTEETVSDDKDLNLSVLEILLDTGRHHQIRVQLSSRNHSIYGDQKYGGRGHGKQIALWAYSLKIIHPITKKEMIFEAIPEKIGSWKILEGIM